MEAPLGRAVIGGLLVSTFATLLILPAVFAIVMGQRASISSPSLHPDDPESSQHDPEHHAGQEPAATGPETHVKSKGATSDDVEKK